MIFEHLDYKEALRVKIKDLQKKKKDLTLKKLANQLGVQSTYFSKFFNSENTHLNDDHLFLLTRILELDIVETDYILLLKAYTQAQSIERQDYLRAKIEKFQKESPTAVPHAQTPMDKFESEMSYLLDPLCLLVNLGLFIEEFRQFPFRLAEKLNISNQKFEGILRTLASNDLITLDDEFQVKEVRTNRIHYGKDHPLMRVHQSLMKSKINSDLLRIDENDKHSILISFTADENSFQRIKEAHNRFMKEAELIAKDAKNQGVYQISFDLFKWL